MAYSDFTLTKVRSTFKLIVNEKTVLFADVEPIVPSEYFKTILAEYIPLASGINTEKARSELIIAPVLLELRRLLNFQIGFFSGSEFNADPESGLSGYCDYILTASSDFYEIRSPVVTLVEAKNENIKSGLGPCIAEMLGAQKFNQQQNDEIETIYGCVTTGNAWKFLKLVYRTVFIDLSDYYIKEVDKILGILAKPLRRDRSIKT
ncbi:MAG: hypothetical protein MUE44_16170 [Oscillatoriaceae cyanobacterium Prado104]|jgi:hypothetical protein|nr:hypothetical protein [Oscillatoriaceae cyanobacterium Prado104]